MVAAFSGPVPIEDGTDALVRRLREKIELTMDDRQVAALAVGALLLLAGMFALGLLVGTQLARRSPQPTLAGDLAALDEQRAHARRIAAPPARSEEPADRKSTRLNSSHT